MWACGQVGQQPSMRAWRGTWAFCLLHCEGLGSLEVPWRSSQGDLPAVLAESLGSPFLPWGHAALVRLVAPGHLCLLSHLWPLHGQWLHYCHCSHDFLKLQAEGIIGESPHHSHWPSIVIQRQTLSSKMFALNCTRRPFETVQNTAKGPSPNGISNTGHWRQP